MKIHREHQAWNDERGMATLVCLILMAIMLSLVMAESSALFQLHREVKLLEHKQINRLDNSQTKPITVTKSESK